MITRRRWGRLVLAWMLTLGLAHNVLADTTVVQAGRRRPTDRESATAQQPTRSQSNAAATVERQEAPPARAEISPARSSTPERVDPLLQLAERAIEKTSQRYLDADKHTPWQIMHGVVALRRDFELTRGAGKVNCVEFISNAPTFRGESWWQVTEHGGRAHPFSVPYAFEGHVNQFLALLSMSNLPLTHEIRIDAKHTVTMADMVHHAKMAVSNRGEITWTLWFLTHYIDIDEEWTNAAGESWSMEELVRIQTASPVIGTACGGCHGLFAIAYARNAYLQKHGRLRGVYFQADQKLKKYIELARTMQNYDGSFATEFFKGTGHSRDFNERLKASGHMLEWLMMALPEERLSEAWVRKGVASISTDLIHNAAQPAECGPLYHSLNSLIMYRDRARGPQTPDEQSLELAETTPPVDEAESKPTDIPPPMPLVEPEIPAKRLIVSAPAGPRRTTLAEPPDASSDAPAEPVPAIAARPDPAEKLARKAAERLAGTVRKDQTDGEPEQIAEKDELPGLLKAPNSKETRVASEPAESVVR